MKNTTEWNLPISKEEWEEIMAAEQERQMIEDALAIEATLAELAEEQERELEEEFRRHAGGHTGVNDIDFEPEDYYENAEMEHDYALAGWCHVPAARHGDFGYDMTEIEEELERVFGE